MQGEWLLMCLTQNLLKLAATTEDHTSFPTKGSGTTRFRQPAGTDVKSCTPRDDRHPHHGVQVIKSQPFWGMFGTLNVYLLFAWSLNSAPYHSTETSLA